MPSAPAFDEGFRQYLRALLTWRRDVRRFRRDPLPPGAVERLIELAALAPSVGLSQPWRFVVVDDVACRGAVRRNFAAANAAALAAQAPERVALYARLKLEGSTRPRVTSPSSPIARPRRGMVSGVSRCPR